MPDDREDNGADGSDPMSDIEDDTENVHLDDDKMDGMADGQEGVKKKYDPKDPSRPRRKKARRACFACQRAHLTCGDERPCKRCIKRGLADACQDGVRKKAKYLHDAPVEALRPVLGPNFNSTSARSNGQRQRSTTQSEAGSVSSASQAFLPQGNAGTYPVFAPGAQAQVTMPENIPFNTQASPVSQQFAGGPSASPSQMNNILGGNPIGFNALFDPSNPALYNFDLEGLDFGSQYAGWEFGILNKMALGADTPSRENSISQATDTGYGTMFGSNGGNAFDSSMMGGEYPSMDPNNMQRQQGSLQHGLPHAYAIAAAPTSLASPSTESTTSPKPLMNSNGSPIISNNITGLSSLVPGARMKTKPDKIAQILGKKQRDSAAIYASVKEPYPYTAGFHNMISVLRDRLPLNKLIKIARYLGEIRPSFIACTKDLTREDLVFMEKCFQRTLVEFNDFLQHSCAPTIVCRRSGEIAAVNKEFTALTGWTKDVLLGKEPNQNVYSRALSTDAGDDTEGSRTGTTTPGSKGPTSGGTTADSGVHPVFLAELLDDDSVVDFYHDFAQLAFEDSRGKVQRCCRLMKYRTQGDMDLKDLAATKGHRAGILSNRVTKIESEHGISRIEKNGKVDCTYCWTIKRDMFDIPMMIIINFLPRYNPNQDLEPHQLAV